MEVVVRQSEIFQGMPLEFHGARSKRRPGALLTRKARKQEIIRALRDERVTVEAADGLLWLSTVERAYRVSASSESASRAAVGHRLAVRTGTASGPQYVQQQLGHETLSTTLRYYAHWIPREVKESYAKLIDARAGEYPQVALEFSILTPDSASKADEGRSETL